MVHSTIPANHQKSGQTQPMATAANQPFIQSPPAYGSTNGLYAVVSPPVVVVVREDRQRTNARFCRALFWGIVIWVLLSGLVRSYIELISWHHGRHRHWVVKWTSPWEYQIPSHVHLDNCTPQDGWKDIRRRDNRYWTAETNFDLPLNSETLYMLSRGDMSGGSSTFFIDPRLGRNQVRVNVAVHYTDTALRDLVKVCQVARSKTENGVGIFTPHYQDKRPRNSYMWFETKFSLPSSASNYVIKNLETDLPNTVHDLKDLSPYFFKYIELQSTNAPISADALRFYDASIRSTNSPITGVFNTTDSLVIKTSNGNIKVDVGATASNGISPKVAISTTNGPLHADISLLSAINLGNYEVATSTTNSPLDVTFLTQPVDAVLRFTGSTTNSPAVAVLNPLFEGNFDLHSTIFAPSVKYDYRLEDPSGRGRKRIISSSGGKGDAFGQVTWGNSRERKGHATLRTTNSPATLHL